MRVRLILAAAAVAAMLAALAGTAWVATPPDEYLELPQQLRAAEDRSLEGLPYARDFAPLARGFRPQVYRSFCGPASITTVLRAYGVADAEQTSVFPSLRSKLKAFYTGMTLAELDALARSAGLRTDLVYADTLNLDTFRKHLKANLAREGDFVVVNYDRRALGQAGAGHISTVGAYDEARDSFLVLDEAAYRYPFTWVPTDLLYGAVHTQSGDRFRGVLFIQGYDPADRTQ
jgi:hypothetical protein